MNFTDARQRMINNQIRANRVTDPFVLSSMEDLPREAFTPKAMKDVAYMDEAIPLGHGRYMMAPMIIARLAEAARIEPTDVVLEIGCGEGYASALLARLSSAVVALESDHELASQSARTLGGMGIDNVEVVEGRLENGYPKQAPYDVIFINGGVSAMPPGILDQMADGGRLAVLFANGPLSRAAIITRAGKTVSRTDLFDAASPILPGFSKAPVFTL